MIQTLLLCVLVACALAYFPGDPKCTEVDQRNLLLKTRELDFASPYCTHMCTNADVADCATRIAPPEISEGPHSCLTNVAIPRFQCENECFQTSPEAALHQCLAGCARNHRNLELNCGTLVDPQDPFAYRTGYVYSMKKYEEYLEQYFSKCYNPCSVYDDCMNGFYRAVTEGGPGPDLNPECRSCAIDYKRCVLENTAAEDRVEGKCAVIHEACHPTLHKETYVDIDGVHYL